MKFEFEFLDCPFSSDKMKYLFCVFLILVTASAAPATEESEKGELGTEVGAPPGESESTVEVGEVPANNNTKWCWPWQTGTSMAVCKKTSKQDCTTVNSGDAW